MIWLSENASNCWNTLKSSGTLLTGDRATTRKTSERGAISNQATLKGAEGSTTKESNLISQKVKSSRMGRCFCILAGLLIGATTFFASMMMANVVSHDMNLKILWPVIRLIPVEMRELVSTEKSSDLCFEGDTVFSDVSFAVGMGMIWPVNHAITVVHNKSFVIRIDEFQPMLASDLSNSGRRDSYRILNFLRGQSSADHHLHNIFGNLPIHAGIITETFAFRKIKVEDIV